MMDGASVGYEVRSHKVLVSVFCGLVIVAVGLVITIAVIKMNNSESENGESAVEEETVSEEQMAEWSRQYQEFSTLIGETRTEAEALLKEEPANISGIYELYGKRIDDYISKERFDYAWSFVVDERDLLQAAGYNNEALEAMTRIDYSSFSTAMQYECYMQILNLARELGNEAVIEKFEKKAADTKEAWESVQEATLEAESQFEAEIKSAGEQEQLYSEDDEENEEGDIER